MAVSSDNIILFLTSASLIFHRYVDVLTAQLKQKLTLCDKLSRLAARAAEQRSAAGSRAAELRPVLTRIVQRTKELQTQVTYEYM